MRVGETWKRLATRWGVVAGFAALCLWPAYALRQDPFFYPFVTALVLTAVAGLSLLTIAIVDLATVRRSRHARPARAFDVVLGLVFAGPSVAALSDLLALS